MPEQSTSLNMEFLEFLKANGVPESAKLELKAKSGETISRTFDVGYSEEVFKSLDLVKTLFPSQVSSKPYLTSGDWVVDLAKDHIEVPYDKYVFESSGPGSNDKVTSQIARPPPQKVASNGKTDWNALYNDGLSYQRNDLSTLIEAANRARPEPIATSPPIAAADPSVKTKSDKKKKPRKVVPELKDYVDDYKEQGEPNLILNQVEIFCFVVPCSCLH